MHVHLYTSPDTCKPSGVNPREIRGDFSWVDTIVIGTHQDARCHSFRQHPDYQTQRQHCAVCSGEVVLHWLCVRLLLLSIGLGPQAQLAGVQDDALKDTEARSPGAGFQGRKEESVRIV
jgi:hypothetical protein